MKGNLRSLLRSVIVLASMFVGSLASAQAQSWSEPSDIKSLGIIISSITQSIQQSKPDDIRWRQAWPMYVDGTLMSDSTFREHLQQIFTACASRTVGREIGHPAYENVFGPFRDFQLTILDRTIAGDSAIYHCTFGLHLNGEKEVAGYMKFYRVERFVWRLDTINGLLQLLQGEVLLKPTPTLGPSPKKKIK